MLYYQNLYQLILTRFCSTRDFLDVLATLAKSYNSFRILYTLVNGQHMASNSMLQGSPLPACAFEMQHR